MAMNSALLLVCSVGLIFLRGLPDHIEGASLEAVRDDGSAKLVCYLGSWANYRSGKGKFVIEDIDTSLCTHLIYGFAKLGTDNRIAAYDPYLDLKENYGLGAYERFNALKKKNPKLSTLIAIGGWNEGSTKYSQMASSPQLRKIFVDSCVEFLSKFGFDGLDVDWEYPALRGGSPSDKANFVSLLKELREALSSRGYLLTAAVSAGKATIDQAYDIPAISKYLDFINLMAYDFNGAWAPVTGHNAPLEGHSGDSKILNVEFAINYWIKGGTPPEKLILGMPLYGRTFALQDINRNGIGAPATGKGLTGPYTGEAGYLGYNEICEMFQADGSWEVVFDETHKAPYAYKDRQWLSFDNVRSLPLKVNLVKKYNLGGAMVWSIETDDFQDTCNTGRYPLINTIKRNLVGHRPATTQTVLPTTEFRPETTTPKTEVTTPSNSKIECKEVGYFAHPHTCKMFIRCVQDYPSGFKVYEFHCPPATVWSRKMGLCTYPDEVPECKNAV